MLIKYVLAAILLYLIVGHNLCIFLLKVSAVLSHGASHKGQNVNKANFISDNQQSTSAFDGR